MDKIMNKIAVFDFDGTLTKSDSFIAFIRFCFGPWSLVKGLMRHFPLLLMMKMGLADNGKTKECLFSYFFKDMPYDRFRELGQQFVCHLDADVNPSALSLLNRHVEAGHKVYVVSASIEEWVGPWCASHGLSHVVCTQVEIGSDGKLTGRFKSPNCYGPEKVRRFTIQEPDRSAYHLVAYGDSKGDKQMMLYADERYKL